MTVRIRNHDAGRFLAILCDDVGRNRTHASGVLQYLSVIPGLLGNG